jgi:hypothetical protein
MWGPNGIFREQIIPAILINWIAFMIVMTLAALGVFN